jgi:hypothetical protein
MKTVNVEIVLNSESHISKTSIISIAQHYLESINVRGNTVISKFDNDLHPILHSEAKAIIIEEIPGFDGFINFAHCVIKWHIYTLDLNGPMNQIEEGDEEGQLNIATHLMLPSADIYNLWENLYYDNNIKQNVTLRSDSTCVNYNFVVTKICSNDDGIFGSRRRHKRRQL